MVRVVYITQQNMRTVASPNKTLLVIRRFKLLESRAFLSKTIQPQKFWSEELENAPSCYAVYGQYKFNHNLSSNHDTVPAVYLPPASEGWGKVLFSVCLSVHISGGGGTPSQVGVEGGYPGPGLSRGGTPS